MTTGRKLWIRIMGCVCILFGLQYLVVSILLFIVMGIKEFSGIFGVVEAYVIIYTICFIAGGIGLLRLHPWGKGILITIFSIDLITYMLAMVTQVSFILNKSHPAMASDSMFKPFGTFYAMKIFIELMLLVSLSRMKFKNTLIPNNPDNQPLEEIPAGQ